MLKKLWVLGLSVYAAVAFAAPHFPLKNGLDRQEGEAKILTSPEQLSFKNEALLLGGRANELRLTLPDWHGESGSVIFDFQPVNWDGQSAQENIIFVQSIDGLNGNFSLYKYESVSGLWLMTQAKLSTGKSNNQFPVMDRKALSACRNGEWQQLAMVWKRGEFVNIYLNGSLVGSASGAAFFPDDFTTIAIGRNTGGVAKYQTQIKNLIFDRRPLTEAEIKLYCGGNSKSPVPASEAIIPLAPMASSKLDGVIHPDEYPTMLPGLLDSSKNFELASGSSITAWGQDDHFFYLGAEITLPENYQPLISTSARDDDRQSGKGDIFVLFLTQDSPSNKAFSGMYFTLNAANNIYDAQESVDWTRGNCQRDAAADFGIRSVSRVANGRWTVELAIPRPAAKEGEFRVSLGFLVNGIRYTLTPQPIWFDHYQGLARLAASQIGVKARYDGLDSGEIRQHLELSATVAESGKADFELVSPDFRRSSEGMVVDQLINEKLDILSGKSFDRQSREFKTASGAPAELEFSARLAMPDVYLLNSQLTTGGKPFFHRQFMFRFFPSINVMLTPVPSKNMLLVHPVLYGDARTRSIDGRIRLTLIRNGVAAMTRDLAVSSRIEAELPLDQLEPGDYKLETALFERSGKLVHSSTVDWTRPPHEQWRQERAGIAALSTDWCPEPWTPILQQHNLFSVWGRDYDWNGDSMLAQITSHGQKLLAAPVALKCRTREGEKTAVWSETKILSTAPGRVRLEKSGKLPGLRLKAEYTLEFDGLVTVRILIKPESAAAIETLSLEFPFADLPLMTVQSRRWWQTGRVCREEWKTFPSLWLGNDQVGCNLAAESCRGWWIDSGNNRVEVLPSAAGPTVRLLIVNKPGELKHELDFTILLQAGPVKPNFRDWRDFRLVGGTRPAAGGNAFYVDPRFWSSSYSRPLPLNYERFNDMVKSCHASGQKTYCYLTPFAISTYDIIPRGTPVTKWSEPVERFSVSKKKDSKPVEEYLYNAVDWNLKPAQFTGDGIAGRETTEMAYVAPDSSWADYFADAIRQMLEKSDFDGLYFDLPLPRENFDDTKNLSYITRDGTKEGTVQLLAARDLYKRLYWLFAKYRTDRHPWMIGHHIRELYPINAFCDLELHGEGIKPKHAFDYTATWLQPVIKGTPVAQIAEITDITAPGFRAAHGGTHSIPSIVLPQYGYSAELNRRPELARELLGWTLSEGTLLWPVYIDSGTVTNFWQKLKRDWGGFLDTEFTDARCSKYRISPDSLRTGLYRKSSGQDNLLVLFNPENKSIKAEVSLPERYQVITDFETDQSLPPGTGLTVEVPSHGLKILRLKR